MITVNGREQVAWQEGMTVQGLLKLLHYTYPQLVISINGVLVPEEAYTTEVIPDDAEMQVIHLMAGG